MEDSQLLKVFLSLIFVLALMGALAFLLRKLEQSRFAKGLKSGRRLQMVEQLYLDPKHKLVLVRRDDKEHLVLVGPSSAATVEQNIAAAPPSQSGGAHA